MHKTTWLILAALPLALPALAGGKDRRAYRVEHEPWYFNGSEWKMATTSWLGAISDDASVAGNYDNGLPVSGDDLLFPEDATRAMGSNMDAFAGAKATGTLTLTGNAVAAETVTISVGAGLITYTFVSTLSSANDVLIGASASDTLDNLIAAVTGAAGEGTTYGTGTTAHTQVTAVAGAGDTMDVTALYPRAEGNAIDTTETMTNGSWGGTDLSGGTDFIFNLIFIGSGHTFDIGDSANPLLTVATKLVHQGSGQLFFRLPGEVTPAAMRIVVNSTNRVGAATLSGTSAVPPWDTSQIMSAVFTSGNVTVENTLEISKVFAGYKANPAFDVEVTMGTAEIAVLYVYGGNNSFSVIPNVIYLSAGLNAFSGTNASTTPTFIQLGGRIDYKSAQTIGILSLLGGIFDTTDTTEKLTITTLNKAPDPIATLYKSDDLVTITTTVDFTGGDTP